MEISRREFGRITASSLLFLMLPTAQGLLATPLADTSSGLVHEQAPVVTVESRGKGNRVAKVAASKHHSKPSSPTSFSDGFSNLNFGPWKAGMPAQCPVGGQMSVVVNSNGSWSFNGGFPSQASGMNCTVALAIGLRASNGKVVAFTAGGTVTNLGWSFSKQGNSPVIRQMWPQLVSGHDFSGSWLAHQIPRANHQSSQNTGNDTADVVSTIANILGVVSLILG